MNELLEEIVRRIRAHGPMPFAAYMQLALYDPRHGYYSGGEVRTGWQGHFVTSPELDPAFGGLWAKAFEQVWERSGKPERFEIVEIGPGEGGFARAVLEHVGGEFLDALTYRLVERVPEVRARQENALAGQWDLAWSDSVTALPEIPHGCVFANEILDNLPVHLIEGSDDGVIEICVDERDGELCFSSHPPSNPELQRFTERTGTTPSPGTRVEVTLAAESLIGHLASRLRSGAIYLVDYGAEGPELAQRGGSLLAYSGSAVDDDVLADPGHRDITAHANWSSVMQSLRKHGFAVDGPTAQRDVLLDLGARELDLELKLEHERALGQGLGLEAMRALSRRQALAALLDRGGLGGLEVVAGYRTLGG